MAKKKTTEQLKKEIYELVNNEYDILEDYKGALIKIKFKHNCDKCDNHEFDMYPSNFLRGERCPLCSTEKASMLQRKNLDEIYLIIKNKNYEFIEWVSAYKNVKSKFVLKCSNGHLFTTYWNKFYHADSGCPYCTGNAKISKEIVYNDFINHGFIPQFKNNDYKNIK